MVERALREEIAKVKAEKFKELLEDGLNAMDLSPEEWVKAIKESRRER